MQRFENLVNVLFENAGSGQCSILDHRSQCFIQESRFSRLSSSSSSSSISAKICTTKFRKQALHYEENTNTASEWILTHIRYRCKEPNDIMTMFEKTVTDKIVLKDLVKRIAMAESSGFFSITWLLATLVTWKKEWSLFLYQFIVLYCGHVL